VLELLGPSVKAVVGDIHQGGESLELETILKMSRQLLQAIAFIHRVGYAHGGTVEPKLFVILVFVNAIRQI
jgi:serine/threonine-protein kinase SRPK3